MLKHRNYHNGHYSNVKIFGRMIETSTLLWYTIWTLMVPYLGFIAYLLTQATWS